MAWARLRLARFTSMPTELFLCHYPNRAMSESVDYKKKYMEAQLELIDTKARLATIESMYWKQQKMMNDDQDSRWDRCLGMWRTEKTRFFLGSFRVV